MLMVSWYLLAMMVHSQSTQANRRNEYVERILVYGKLACFMSPDIYDWDKNDIELMLDGVGCVETVVDF